MTIIPMKPTNSIEIKELLKFADRKFKSERGSFLFQEGMAAEELYIIISGKVQISKITTDGRELSLRICGENDICGELTLFTDNPKYLLSAKVLEEGEIVAIKKDVIESEIFQNPTLSFEFMKWMSDHFRKTQTKSRYLVLNSKKCALFSKLIRMTNRYEIIKNKKGKITVHDLQFLKDENGCENCSAFYCSNEKC